MGQVKNGSSNIQQILLFTIYNTNYYIFDTDISKDYLNTFQIPWNELHSNIDKDSVSNYIGNRVSLVSDNWTSTHILLIFATFTFSLYNYSLKHT